MGANVEVKMASSRRMGLESSEVRAQLIEAADQLVREEGCAAVTARRLAEKVGLKRQIVHYYFGAIEDLFVALIRRNGDRIRERIVQALESDEPLRVLWETGNNATATIFEFTGMAMRSAAIQAEVKRYMEMFRQIETQALARHLELRGIKSAIPPAALAIVVTSISQTLAVEQALDVSEGHAETRALVEDWLRGFAERGEWPMPARGANGGA